MRVKIESKGILDGIQSILRTLSSMMDKMFKSFENDSKYKDIEVDVSKKKEVDTKDGSGLEYPIGLTEKEPMGTFTIIQGDDDTFSIVFKMNDGVKDTLTGVKKDDIDSKVGDWFLKYITKKKVKSSKSIEVTLEKVSGSTQDEIYLRAIRCNCDVQSALDVLDSILDKEEFTDMISDEPASFELIDDGAEYIDIEPTDLIDCSTDIDAVLGAAITFLLNLKAIHWNAKGDKFFDLHNNVDNWYYAALNQLDTIGEIAGELNESVPNPASLIRTGELVADNCLVDQREGYELCNSIMSSFILSLETFYVNFSHDIQSTLDEFIRYWKKERDYKIARSLK